MKRALTRIVFVVIVAVLTTAGGQAATARPFTGMPDVESADWCRVDSELEATEENVRELVRCFTALCAMGASVIATKSLREAGLKSEDFEGCVVTLGGKPLVELHLYDPYFTVFWPARVNIDTLKNYLHNVAEELAVDWNTPWEDMNVGDNKYRMVDGNVRKMKFIAGMRDPRDAWKMRIRKDHRAFLRIESGRITFARFDLRSPMPLILWAGLVPSTPGGFQPSQRPQLGFSCHTVPESLAEFVNRTSSLGRRLSESDQTEVYRQLVMNVGDRYSRTDRGTITT